MTINTKFFRSWQLIWCQEHCFRPEREGFRKSLKVQANMHGADLACVKKLDKFFLHFERLRNLWPPVQFDFFGIVTDWREAKPCLDAFEHLDDDLIAELQLTPAQTKPRFIVVFCDHEFQRTKALQWAESKAVCGIRIYCLQVNMDINVAPGMQGDMRVFADVLRAAAASGGIERNVPYSPKGINQSMEPAYVDIQRREADIHIPEPSYTGISTIDPEDLARALANGQRLRL